MARRRDAAPGFMVAGLGTLDHAIRRRRGARPPPRRRQTAPDRGRAGLLRQAAGRGLSRSVDEPTLFPPGSPESLLIAERNAGLFAEISDFRDAGFCGILCGTTTAWRCAEETRR